MTAQSGHLGISHNSAIWIGISLVKPSSEVACHTLYDAIGE